MRDYLAPLTTGTAILWSQRRRVIAEVDGIADHRLVALYSDLQVPKDALPVITTAEITAL